MKISVIPWHVFFKALKKQHPSALENWLRHWLFTNEGIIMSMARRQVDRKGFRD